MPRRPSDRGGGKTIQRPAAATSASEPPHLLAVHFHRGGIEAAPLHPKLKALLALWREKRGRRDVPTRGDLPVYALGPWKENVALLEPAPGKFRFRLGGASLLQRFGCETTGHTLDDLDPALRKALLAHLDLATAKQAPVAAATVLRNGGTRILWSDLMLPLAGGRAGPPLLLLGSYSIKPVPP